MEDEVTEELHKDSDVDFDRKKYASENHEVSEYTDRDGIEHDRSEDEKKEWLDSHSSTAVEEEMSGGAADNGGSTAGSESARGTTTAEGSARRISRD